MNLSLAKTIPFVFAGALGASHIFKTYSRRRKLAGARVHPLAIFIYGVFGVAGVLAAIFLGYCVINNAEQVGFVDRGFRLLWALILFGWTLSLVFEARLSETTVARSVPKRT